MKGRERFYSEFAERGYRLKAYIHSDGPHFVIRVWRESTGELVREERLPPMQFEPRWGVDVSDIQILEERTEEIMRTLP